MKRVLFISVMVSVAFPAVADSIKTALAATDTGYYYFSGQVHECLMDSALGVIQDAKVRDELKSKTSRDKLVDDATLAIAQTKPRWLKETLYTWLLRSTRYEEGEDSVRVLWQKDIYLVLDECHSLVPYIEENILKRTVVPHYDDSDPEDQDL